MLELYGIVANIDNAEIITLLGIILFCALCMAHLWKIAGLTGRRFTTVEWIRIYFYSILIFLSGVVTFAKLFFPENAEKLLEILHLNRLLQYIATKVQILLLSIIRLML